MTDTDITALFQRFPTLKVGVIGDFALDLYYQLETQTRERSLETGLDVFWGSQPCASLGAAGNVVQNLNTLGIARCWAIGCIGDDLFGREMRHLFRSLGVHTEHLHVLTKNWDTCLYTKPNQSGQEANRIDFGTGNFLDDVVFQTLLTSLEQLLSHLDVLIINQQFPNPLLTKERVAVLNELMALHPHVLFVADMRDVGMHIQGATLKVNTAELAKFLHTDLPDEPDADWCTRQGALFRQQTSGPLLITRGHAGVLYIDDVETQQVEGLPLVGELDTVGAGDTVVATWAACMGAGATPLQALEIANLAAGVTVQKLGQTGTASLPEILGLNNRYSLHD